MTALHYNYVASKEFCKSIGLFWLGDDFLISPDAEAHELVFTQEQVDAAMRHHLWQVKWLFTPQNFGYWDRIKIAFWFLFGRWK